MSYSKKHFGLKPSVQFGDYLRGLREQNTTLTQADAARHVGLSPELYNGVEQGKKVARDLILIQLARLYHVPPDEVLKRAYWPQLVLLPLIAIIEPEQLPTDFIEKLEKGFEKAEREELTQFIRDLLGKRITVGQH